jgi:choline dehydrogenase-like flavoprotein
MATALELEQLGRDVLVLESGAGELDATNAEASRAEIADRSRHAQMELAVCRALGGTSWTWGGRCVAFDDVDFLDRDFVCDAQWPIAHDAIRPWYKRASKYLLCGDDSFDIPYLCTLTDGLTLDSVERWSTESRLILVHRDVLLRSLRIKISLRSTVTELNLTNDGQTVESLAVATPNGPRTLRARHFIIAAGGVETTRLLLHFQRSHPRHFGGIDGPLGRYYMGHVSGKIASIQFNRPEFITEMDFKLDANGAFYRRRFKLTLAAQMANRVLNTAFFADNPPFHDPNHCSGVLSAVFLALAFPPTGRRLLSERVRLTHTGPGPYMISAHLRNAILGAPRGAADMYRILRDRFLVKPRKPGFVVRNHGGRYALHYHAEQVPTSSSRIRLSGERDSFGVHRASIDLRYTDQDIDSVIESHRLLDRALRANRIGSLVYWNSPEEMRNYVWKAASGGTHQIGSARMGVHPAQSVVSPDSKVHGLSNLHVASTAVFPSGSQANPTLLAVALAMRLVHRLAGSKP